MKILIVEDELLVADYIRRIVVKNSKNVVVGIVDTIAEAKKAIENIVPDICLVDIRLSNNDSGIILGKFLTSISIPFIYITANNDSETLQSAIETNPFSYLSKPFNENDIFSAIELARKHLKKQSLELTSSKGKFKLNLEDILYIKSDNVYVNIHTENKVYTERKILKEILSELPKDVFVRIHRSFVINKNKIQFKNANSVIINSTEIPISKQYKESIDI